jgi:hypothetical protein
MLRINLSPSKLFTFRTELTQIPEVLMVKERTKGSDYFKMKEDAKVIIALLKYRQSLGTPNLSE